MTGKVIMKKAGTPEPEEMALINTYTPKGLAPEDVYVFSVVLCDNEIDRDAERFSIPALKKLGELYIGKTGIYDHSMRTENQVARIISTEVVTDGGKQTKAGEEYTKLVARVYTPTKNTDLISDIETGIKKEVSVGCAVGNVTCSICGTDSRDGCEHRPGKSYDGEIAHRVLNDPTDAYEFSFVAVPAQPGAGVIKKFTQQEETRLEKTKQTEKAVTPPAGEVTATSVAEEATPDPEKIKTGERERIAKVMEICKGAGMDAAEYITSGATVESVQTAALEKMIREKAPLSVSVEKDEGDKLRDAMTDALLIKGNLAPEKPSDGADQYKNLTLREIGAQCLELAGVKQARYMSGSDLFSELNKQYFNPTNAFPSILDRTINKAYEAGYNAAPETYSLFTSKGTLTDFKRTSGNYVSGSAGEFLLVPEGAELKHDTPHDHLKPTRQLKTWGRQFTMTREALINDDIGFLTTIPARYAASAKKTINKQVYGILTGNPVIYDGLPLFGDEHKNLIATGTGITNESLQDMINKLMLQTDHDGDAIIQTVKNMIVPVGYGFQVKTLLLSPTINTPGNTQAVNPLYGMSINVIEDATLNTLITESGGGSLPWFITAAESGIQIDYLNGVEIPTIRRFEKPGQLGFVWDIYLDWGISVMDFRGMVKNPGTV